MPHASTHDRGIAVAALPALVTARGAKAGGAVLGSLSAVALGVGLYLLGRSDSAWVPLAAAGGIGLVAGLLLLAFADSFSPSGPVYSAGTHEPEPVLIRVAHALFGSSWGTYLRNMWIYVALLELGLASWFLVDALVKKEDRAGLYAAGVLGAVGLVCAWLGVHASRKVANASRLVAEGIDAEATIVGLGQSQIYLNNAPLLTIDFEVHLPGQPPYRVRHRDFVPLAQLGGLAVGATIPLKVDAANPRNVIAEWET